MHSARIAKQANKKKSNPQLHHTPVRPHYQRQPSKFHSIVLHLSSALHAPSADWLTAVESTLHGWERERLISSKIKRPYSPSTFTTAALAKRTEPIREKSAPLLTAAQRSLDVSERWITSDGSEPGIKNYGVKRNYSLLETRLFILPQIKFNTPTHTIPYFLRHFKALNLQN